MKIADKLEVSLGGIKVGTLVPYKRNLTAFEYDSRWIAEGFPISPFSLPLTPGVKIAKPDPHEGTFGVFAGSLPDGWGRLLMDRMLRKEGIHPEEADAFFRLSVIGVSGLGALEYRPAYTIRPPVEQANLDALAEACRGILQSGTTENLDSLYALGGSSGGARPKVMMKVDNEDWIIKFPSSNDAENIGEMEYEYNLCASECGIEIPEIRLFHSNACRGYFGCKRFDRVCDSQKIKKIHMASASALLEITHRIPSLDYTSLMALTWQLTKKSDELEKLFRLMCFNIFSHNRDDHSNNFSYLCENGVWRLSPAYDLTYSNSIGGEHATTVAGEGKNPGLDNILQVAKKAGIKESKARDISNYIKETVNKRLGRYLQ